MAKVTFHLYKMKQPSGAYKTFAVCEELDDGITMDQLSNIVEKYSTTCEPVFTNNKKPFIVQFVLEFEEHMYTAFLLAET